MLAAYVYAFILGLSCFLNPFINYHYSFTSPTALSSARFTAAVAASQLGICVLPLVYFIDAALAASPFRWCCMRGIPPKNVIQHHAPFIAGMLPSAQAWHSSDASPVPEAPLAWQSSHAVASALA